MKSQHTFALGLVQRLVPRTFDLVCLLLYLGTAAVHVYFRQQNLCTRCSLDKGWSIPLVTLGVLLLIINDRVEFIYFNRNRVSDNTHSNKPVSSKVARRAAVCFLIIRFALIFAVAVIDSFDFSLFLFLLIPFTAFATLGKRVAYTLTLLCWPVGLFVFHDVTYGPIHDTDFANQIIFYIIYSFGLVFMLLMAQVVDRETRTRQKAEQLLEELALSHQQLRDYSQRITELAVTEERNRLARDIHDSLGHYLTVINVQLEKALAFRDKKPTEADQAVRTSKRLASEALMETRRSVGALRDQQESFSLSQALQLLVNDVQRDELAVQLQIDGEEEGFSYQSLMTIYRAAQEGLTNIQKHANAEQVTVDVRLGEQEASLQLCDNGKGFNAADWQQQSEASSSYGLRGVQERLELIGGTLLVESKPGVGAKLFVTVPKNPLTVGRGEKAEGSTSNVCILVIGD